MGVCMCVQNLLVVGSKTIGFLQVPSLHKLITREVAVLDSKKGKKILT